MTAADVVLTGPARLAISALRGPVGRVAEIHGLDLIVLFGSQAVGRAHAASDVDLAVAAPRPLEFRQLVDVTSDLQEIFGGVRADVSDLRRADPLFLRKIFESGLCLFERPGMFEAARLAALHRYEDYRPFLKLERDCVRQALGLP
jgi:predicted nucleotidyltransferase